MDNMTGFKPEAVTQMVLDIAYEDYEAVVRFHKKVLELSKSCPGIKVPYQPFTTEDVSPGYKGTDIAFIDETTARLEE